MLSSQEPGVDPEVHGLAVEQYADMLEQECQGSDEAVVALMLRQVCADRIKVPARMNRVGGTGMFAFMGAVAHLIGSDSPALRAEASRFFSLLAGFVAGVA